MSRVAKAPAAVKVTVDYLRQATDGTLLGRLLETFTACDHLGPSEAAPKALLAELLKKQYTANPVVDVQVAAACCLAAGLGPGADPSPEQALDAVRLFGSVAQRGASAGGKASYRSYLRQLVEKLSTRHVVRGLAERLAASPKASEAEEALETVSQAFLAVETEDDATAAHVATILGDAILGAGSVSDTQLRALLPALSVPSTRRVATAVLRRNEERLTSAVAAFISHELESAGEEFVAADVLAQEDGDPASADARKAALIRVGKVLETVFALAQVGVNIISGVVPLLQQLLNHDHADLRTLAARTFSRMFLAAPSLATAFPPAFHAFLGRFVDPKPTIRADMLRYARDTLVGAPTDAHWALLSPALCNKLVDSDEGVRKAAVAAVVDIGLQLGGRLPAKVCDALAARCKDKAPKVRQAATERLAELYCRTQLPWIPNAVFASAFLAQGADISLVEFALAAMLPAAAGGTEAASKTAAARANAKKQAKLSFQAPTRKGSVLDFDGNGPARADSKARAFARLCGALGEKEWGVLLVLMGKKAQLRLTVQRLVEMRQSIKAKVNTEASTEAAIRLINFLNDITHSRDEWGDVFKTSDEATGRLLLQLCGPECMDLGQAGEALLGHFKAKRSELFKFFDANVCKRLYLPFAAADVSELVALAEAQRRADSGERLGAVRAIEALAKMAPQLLTAVVGTVAKWVKEDSDHGRRSQDPALTSVTSSCLRVLHAAATSGAGATKEVHDRKNEIIVTLGKICLHGESAPLAKDAARCLVGLFKSQTSAFSQLLMKLQERLAIAAAQGEAGLTAAVAAHIKAFAVFVAEVPDATLLSADLIADSIQTIMATAVKTHTDEDDTDAAATRKLPGGLVRAPCLRAEIVDAAAKALCRHTLALPGSRAAVAAPALFDALLAALRDCQQLPSGSLGQCRRRLALVKQLMRLVLLGEGVLGAGTAKAAQLDFMRRELTVMMLVSSEENSAVRHALQGRLKAHIGQAITAGRSDPRFVAMLAMSAVSEDTRHDYNDLKELLEEVSDKMRTRRSSLRLALSDANAPRMYLEYVLPPLVLYCAHHPLYIDDRDAGDDAFRLLARPFQLILDEIFRHGVESANVVQEIFRKLRGMDDVVPQPAEPDASRVVCDLGAKVMLAILAEKSVVTGAPFPGSLLLPWYFAPPKKERFAPETVFLPAGVSVAARPLFGAPVGVFGSAVKASQTPARGQLSRSEQAASIPPYNDDDDNDAATGKRGRDDGSGPAEADLGGAYTPNAGLSPQPKGAAKRSRVESEARRGTSASQQSASSAPPAPVGVDGRLVFDGVLAVVGRYAPDEAVTIKFKEVKEGVQARLGRQWSDAEKAYAKECLGAILTSASQPQ